MNNELRAKMAEVLRGQAVPHENKLTLGDLCEMLTTDYRVNGRRSLKTLPYSVRHIRDFFGDGTKAVAITTDRMQAYILHRQREGAASATINIELALLGKAFTLAVRARRLRARPYIPKLAADPSRVRRGFFSRDEVEQLAEQLPDVHGLDLIHLDIRCLGLLHGQEECQGLPTLQADPRTQVRLMSSLALVS